MAASLRYRFASSKRFGIVCVFTAIGVCSVEAQTLERGSHPPVVIEDGAPSLGDQPVYDSYVRETSAGEHAGSYAEACPPCDLDCCECEPCCSGRVPMFVFGEFLFLKATDGDIAHAQQQNGIGGAGTVPFGRIGTVDMDYEPAFRVGGGICLDPCSALIVSYTRYDGDGFDELAAPDAPGGGGAVGSLVHHPGAVLTASPGPVTASYDLSYNLADVVFRDQWRASDCYAIHYSIGGQFANLSQEFEQNGFFGGSSGGAIDTETEIDFNGGGFKVGLDGERWLGSRVSVYGKFSAAAVSGKFSSDYSMRNVTIDTILAEAQWDDNRVISIVEYELGMAYTSCSRRWRLSAGYLFQHWGNMVTTSNFIDGVQADNYTDLSDGLGFNGLTTRLEICF